MAHPDFVIAGAGLIGLTIALELERRGARVVVLDAGQAGAQTSTRAAGMLAVDDPHNPQQLRALSQHSANLYPGFLDDLYERTGERVVFQTTSTLQSVEEDEVASNTKTLIDPVKVTHLLNPMGKKFLLLDERSLDPRQLTNILLKAVRRSHIDLREDTPLLRLKASRDHVEVQTHVGALDAGYIIDCMGAWSPAHIAPCKGQMLKVRPSAEGSRGSGSQMLEVVVRTDSVYMVPRTEGPDEGCVIIGATIEDAGFDLEVHARDIMLLHARAVQLVPSLAAAEFVEAWAGLRPATADGLPMLGASAAQPRYLVASGHFRNGILLAPATADVIARGIFGQEQPVDLQPFQPDRFLPATAPI